MKSMVVRVLLVLAFLYWPASAKSLFHDFSVQAQASDLLGVTGANKGASIDQEMFQLNPKDKLNYELYDAEDSGENNEIMKLHNRMAETKLVDWDKSALQISFYQRILQYKYLPIIDRLRKKAEDIRSKTKNKEHLKKADAAENKANTFAKRIFRGIDPNKIDEKALQKQIEDWKSTPPSTTVITREHAEDYKRLFSKVKETYGQAEYIILRCVKGAQEGRPGTTYGTERCDLSMLRAWYESGLDPTGKWDKNASIPNVWKHQLQMDPLDEKRESLGGFSDANMMKAYTNPEGAWLTTRLLRGCALNNGVSEADWEISKKMLIQAIWLATETQVKDLQSTDKDKAESIRKEARDRKEKIFKQKRVSLNDIQGYYGFLMRCKPHFESFKEQGRKVRKDTIYWKQRGKGYEKWQADFYKNYKFPNEGL